MNWPKQVRRGLTGLAMTSAAWVHVAHAAPLPEISTEAASDVALYQAAIAQAELLRQQNGGTSTLRPRAPAHQIVVHDAPASSVISAPAPSSASAAAMPMRAQMAAYAPIPVIPLAPPAASPVPVAQAQPAAYMRVASQPIAPVAQAIAQPVVYAPAAMAQPLAYKTPAARPRITATVTRTPFVPVGHASTNPALADIDTNASRQYAAEMAASQQGLFRAAVVVPAAAPAEAFAVASNAQAAHLAGLTTGAGANNDSRNAMPFAKAQPSYAPPSAAPIRVATTESALPSRYRDAELAPPPLMASSVKSPARAVRPVIVAAQTASPSAPQDAVSPQEAAQAYASVRAEQHAPRSMAAADANDFAQLRPAAGGVRLRTGAIVPMLTAASVAQANGLLSLPDAGPEAAPSLPPIEPLAPMAAVASDAALAPLPGGGNAAVLPPLPLHAIPPSAPVSAEAPPSAPPVAAMPPLPESMPPGPTENAGAIPVPQQASAGPAPLPELPPVPLNPSEGNAVPVAPAADAPLAAPTPIPAAVADATGAPAQSPAPPPAVVVATPPIPLPVSPPDRSKEIAVTAPAPKTTPEKALAAQEKKLAAEARAEKMQANKMPIQMERARPLDNRLGAEGEGLIQRHDGVGLSIAIRTPKLDAAYELGQAYEALMGGDSSTAAAIYQRILDSQPRNVDALFGLATTYHRTGALQKAKPLYATLLAVAPDHRDGLNNFLMLLGEENPQEALARLQSLEASNRSYAPIPAQIAMIYERMGDLSAAVDAMTRAASRAPENIQYRYNLAVLLDKAGNWQDAASIYQDVLAAVDRGERVPSSRDDIQNRLRYLLTRHG